MIVLFSILAIALGIFIFKITVRLFSLGFRIFFSGLAMMLVIVPAIIGLLII